MARFLDPGNPIFYIGPWIMFNRVANSTITLGFQQAGNVLTMAPVEDILVRGFRVHIQGATGSLGTCDFKLGKDGVTAGAAYEFLYTNDATDPSFVGGLFTTPLLYTPSNRLGIITVANAAWDSTGADATVYVSCQRA